MALYTKFLQSFKLVLAWSILLMLVPVDQAISQQMSNARWLADRAPSIVARNRTYRPSQLIDQTLPSLTLFQLEEATRLTNYFRDERPDLAFGFSLDGCSQRAYMIGWTLAKNNMSSVRVWIRTLEENKRLKNPNGTGNWVFHTAIVIAVQTGQGRNSLPELYVIDPAIPPGLQTLDQWKNKLLEDHPEMRHTVTFHPYNDFFGPSGMSNEVRNFQSALFQSGISRESLDFEHALKTLNFYRRALESRNLEQGVCHECYNYTDEDIREIRRRQNR